MESGLGSRNYGAIALVIVVAFAILVVLFLRADGETDVFLLALAAAVGLVAAAFVVGRAWQRRLAERWIDFGRSLGYSAQPPRERYDSPDDATLVGRYGSREVRLRTYTVRHGKTETRYTAFEIPIPDADPAFDLQITREGIDAKIVKALGGQDVETDNPEFDRAFRIQSGNAALAKAALSISAQGALLQMPRFHELRAGSGFRLSDGTVLDARAADFVRNVAKSRGIDVAGAFGLSADATPSSALVLTRQGFHTDPVEAQGIVSALAVLAQAVVAAAPAQANA